MQENLIKAITSYQPDLSSEELQYGLRLFERIHHQANDLILSAGEVCDRLYFANDSITRCFYIADDGKEHTLWMKPEQTFITEYKSFVSEQPSMFSLQLYEETELFSISKKQLYQLYKKSNAWSLFGIALTERVHVTLIDVFVNLLANDATKNYQYIQYMFPRFIQVAPLKDIASMLQMSPVSLSRIRAGTQTKG